MLFHDNVSAHLHEVSSNTHGLPFSWIEMSEVDGFSFKHRFGEPVKFLPVAFIVLNTAFLYVVYLFFHLITLLKTSSSFVLGVVETVVFSHLDVPARRVLHQEYARSSRQNSG